MQSLPVEKEGIFFFGLVMLRSWGIVNPVEYNECHASTHEDDANHKENQSLRGKKNLLGSTETAHCLPNSALICIVNGVILTAQISMPSSSVNLEPQLGKEDEHIGQIEVKCSKYSNGSLMWYRKRMGYPVIPFSCYVKNQVTVNNLMTWGELTMF